MELIQYIFLTISVFSGTIFGIAISKICFEEIDSVSTYLLEVTPLLVPISLGIMIYQSKILLAIIGTIGLIVMLFFLKNKYNPRTLYISSGLVTYLSTKFENNITITVGIIIFLYSMFMITIEASNIKTAPIKKNKKIKTTNILLDKIFFKYSFYLIVAIASYVIFEYILKL
jgi:hypothetical protein